MTPFMRNAARQGPLVDLQSLSYNSITSDAAGFAGGMPLTNIKAADGSHAAPGLSAGSSITMFRYDFGRPVLMLQYSLTDFYWWDGGSFYQCTVTVDFSNDNSIWTNVGTHVIGVPATQVALTNIAGSLGAFYRYARIRVTMFGVNAYLRGDQFRITGYE